MLSRALGAVFLGLLLIAPTWGVIQFTRNTVVNGKLYYTGDVVTFSSGDETTQINAGNAVSYPVTNSSLNALPAIADGTLLGNASGATAAPAALTALPSSVTVASSNLALTNADLPGSSVRYATGTTLTLASTDNGNVVAQSNSSAVAATLPQIGTSSVSAGAFQTLLLNQGTGTVTITPATSTINGAATLAVLGGQSALIFADNTTSPGNYVAFLGLPTTLPASQLTGGTLAGAVALVNPAAVQGTGLIPSSSACTNNRVNLPATNTMGVCTNGTQAITWDANQNSNLTGLPVAAGTAPTLTAISGTCTYGTQTGGAFSGGFTIASGSGTCSVRLGGGWAAVTNGYTCRGSDETAVTTLVNAAHTTSTATVRITSAATNDVVSFECSGY